MNALTIVLLIFIVVFFNYPFKLTRNYLAARRSNLPLVIVPLNPEGIFWLFLKNIVRPHLKPILPKSWYDRMHLSTYGWEFRTKYEMHEKYGQAFILVTAGDNEFWVADPAITQIVLNRRKDFVQQKVASVIMGMLGENILTTNGEDWARQRKVVAPNLNERISESVWNESLIQAGSMAQWLLKNGGSGTNQTVNGIRSIAINVLGQAGYGSPQSWSPDAFSSSAKKDQSKESNKDEMVKGKPRMGYFDAVAIIIDQLLLSALIPSSILLLPFMPSFIQDIGLARQIAPNAANEMLERERASLASGGEEKTNMMSMLVRLADQSKKEQKSGSALYLTEDEIRGNLFIFTAAGFDTTANTMVYATIMMAAYPKWQEWVAEELDEVLKGLDLEHLDYNAIFPKLTRCLALMYETLRHFPPVVHLSRAALTPQTVTTSHGTYYIPAGKVHVDNVGLCIDPNVWGADTLEFKPSRFLQPDSKTGKPSLVTPPRWSFMPWSGGPRACPGQKMSQVEFTAVFMRLFYQCRVEPIRRDGETMEQARRRLVDLTQNSQPRLTLQIENPDKLELRWTRREKA